MNAVDVQLVMDLPSDWRVLPDEATLRSRMAEAAAAGKSVPSALTEVADGVADAMAEGSVTGVSVGRVRYAGGEIGCSVAVRMEQGADAGSVEQQLDSLVAAGVAGGARDDMVRFSGAGPAVRLVWPVQVTGRLRTIMAEYLLPYPGADRRVAVIAVSATGPTVDEDTGVLLEALIADLRFVRVESASRAQ